MARFITKILSRQNFVENIVSEIKSVARTRYPEKRYLEIEELQAKDIVFQNPNFILIQFFGPEDHEPFWFAEIHGSEIYVGCDT